MHDHFSTTTSTPTRAQIIAFSALTGALLLTTAGWTQSRLGDRLLPHAFCISASQPLLMLHLVGDTLIALAYLAIPWSLLRFVRRRPDIPFGWVAWLFGAFIVACGATHAIEVWTLWYPVYWYAGVAKAFTAAVSIGTAWVLYRLGPLLLALPSAEQLRRTNATLEQEVATRKAAEAELERAKQQLEALLSRSTAEARRVAAVLDGFFEAAPTGLALVDESGVFIRVNPALPRVTRRAADEYLGSAVARLPRMPPEVVQAVDRVTRDGRASSTFDVAAVSPADGPVQWQCTVFPIPLGAGTTMCGCIVQDVTRERLLERQREDALNAAEDANLAKDEFLARVSHELRTPLQVAMSSAEALRRIPHMPPLSARVVERLMHAIRMQARMIDDLLDLSRILSGKLHVDNEPTDPAMPLLRVLEHWTQRAAERSVRLDAGGLHQGRAVVSADPTRLEQVYANLLDNAIRFSPEGETVRVAGGVAHGVWRLQVHDRGVGLEPDEVALLFRPFAQGRRQPRTGKGLGLGLAIVRSLVESFGGRVRVHSDGIGQGSTFTVELPLADTPAPPAPPARTGDDVRLDGWRLLYVEDEPDVAAAMIDGLAALGAQVVPASSHDQAMEALASAGWDALVTDLDLGPGPGGREIAAAASEDARHAGLAIVAVSALGDAAREGPPGSGRNPIQAHLVKPVTVEAVARTLLRLRLRGPA